MMPIGGATLAEMRRQGLRPPGFIVVTEDRALATNARSKALYPLVFEPGKDYDWRVVHGLWVHVFSYLKREQVAPICAGIFDVAPSRLGVRYYNDDPEREVIIAAR
jgi:hypothetical protein